ncbi:Phosphoribosyl 1,2-cyclic phosphodiesterase [Desulfatibacillum alkenivorans DSM 16219]|jgi:phosphoribosyl 1,2-cyclic phosphodiesterase|uniref:Phosphoribosyl 1,2-cyclic phosphodiesterase n=1 Tax=Desulfatibacillum alkenivorans DSM 16219 TaxID=1121393 RepID=A0A1M6WQY7_9BACT|nr:MBL fold metallo-hydrolase [Desulfatibacillum alkenivorans]SHK96128.1 Phosphoribosyl 1,2-cyclic phosphodiesterase [Desulfatibacillum alkenivorans DSM 16219]
MKIKYYGVRGTVPTPGQSTIRYGGNTPCVAVWCGEDLVILDAGTGLRVLGDELADSCFGNGKGSATLLISHTHWDHIQGFPFFSPGYVQGNVIRIMGAHQINKGLETAMHYQQQYQNFPVLLSQMPSRITFKALEEGVGHRIGEVDIETAEMNHPGGSFAYRVTWKGKSVVYATDTEHYDSVDHKLTPLCKDADILIYDSTYTPEEYPNFKGYGHSTYEEGIKLARAANVKSLHLFHHHPNHTDEMLDAMQKKARADFPQTYVAREGWELEI